MTLSVIARYRRRGVTCATAFDGLAEAYEFLRQGVESGDIEMLQIDAEDGERLLSRPGFDEMARLDASQREGWLAVLSHALARRRADSREGTAPSPPQGSG